MILDFAGAGNQRKHVQFRSRVQLNCLIKVEVYLLFEFPVGRVRGKNYVSTLELSDYLKLPLSFKW